MKKRRTVYGQKYREELSDALFLLFVGLTSTYSKDCPACKDDQ